MKRAYHSLPLLCLLLTACGPVEFPGPGSSDFFADFGNGYTLGRTSGVYVVISPRGGYSSDAEIIDTRILECGYDTKFVVAKRLDLKAIPEDRWGDALLNPDPKFIDYWIIDAAHRKRYGPLAEADYHAMRSQLGVSDAVVLKSIYDYRPKEN